MTGDAVRLDMLGQRCPAPIIALGRLLRSHPGAQVQLLADDPAAETDVPAWCRMTGAELIEARETGAEAARLYLVRLPLKTDGSETKRARDAV